MSLKVSVHDGKKCEKILKIELPQNEIQKEFDEFYSSVAPKARIPGFRPGKAPRHVLVMHYKDEARETVLKHLISGSYKQALQEKSLEPLGYPEIKDVNFKEDKLSYEAKIEIRPKIKLSRVSGLSAKKQKSEVKAEEVTEALERLRQSFAQYKVVEDRPAQLGDFIIADYVCLVEGKEVEKRNDDWFELKEEEFLKGFSAQLVGAKPGEEKDVQIQLPEKTGRPEIAGKSAAFKIKVKEVKTKVLPALDDSLAKEAGEFQTLAELKQQVEKDLLTSKEHDAEVQFEKFLLDELLKHNKMDLPAGLVSRRLEHLLHDAQENAKKRGGSDEEFKKAEPEIRPKFEAEAARQIHLAFLLDEIANQEKITVTEEDFKKRFERIAHEVRQPLENVERYYAQHEEAKEALQDQIRNEKAIDFIKKNAKVA